MSLQDTFYIVAIVFMGLITLLLIAIGVLLFYIKKRVSDITDLAQRKVDDVLTSVSRPIKAAADITSALLPGRSSSSKSHNKRVHKK